MWRSLSLLALPLVLYSCSPPLVWGGDARTKDRLLKVLPLGSNVDQLKKEASARRWQLSFADNRVFEVGKEHYFGNGCQFKGGVSRNFVVAEYGPIFITSVESVWMFDEDGKLGDVCVRSTTDAL